MNYFILAAFTAVVGVCSSYRLPDTVIPSHYRLEILTNLGDEGDKFDFQGNVWIKTKCVSPATNITLHSKNLDINEEEIVITDLTSNDKKIQLKDIDVDKENDFLILNLAEELINDHDYEIHIPFSGKLEDVLSGFYKSSYEDTDTKKTKYIATTQFESTDARRAFPCFDEPAMKATFEISMGHAEKYSAISNMPKIKTEPIKGKEGWVWTRFEKTVPMSTYLIAFIVSDFGYDTAPPSSNNVTFRIWSRKDALDQVKFAKDVGPKFLEYYEKFYDLKYPLPKQDMVAVPDFAAGAMENWGLITYREAYLLYDPKVSSTTSRHGVASVIAHELAHQWFGNLVTMEWWTDLWLNEGFATYMAALAVHHLFPEWNSLEEESVDNLLAVFGFDSLKSSHPVSVPVGHPREIDQIFDTIAYKKGSYILRMMSLFLGEETLRKGVSKYLHKHKYGNAEQDDLWQSLTDQAHSDGTLPKNLTVKTIMDTWTLQTGYPVITANRLYGKHSLELQQRRFLRDTIKVKTTDKAEECWWVPISYTDEVEQNFNNTSPKYWFPCTEETQVIEGFPHDDKWILLNIQASGLFRVNYDEKNWKLLIDALNSDAFPKIPVLNRVQLMDDASYLSWTGDLDYKIFFDLFKYLKKEEGFLPWRAALRSVGSLNKQLKRSSNYGSFKKYMKHILTPIYGKVGGIKPKKAAAGKLDAVKHQLAITGWSCKFNVGNCIHDATKKFKEYLDHPKNNEIVPKDMRSVIYCNGLKYGGEKEWNFLWEKYLQSNVATEKTTILDSLGCTRELWLLRRFLEWTIQPNSGIRKQDYSSVFSSVAANDVGFFIAQNFLQENIKEIYNSLTPNSKRLSRYLSPLAVQMTTENDYEWFSNFTTTNAEYLKDAKQGVDQSLETIRLNIQWQNKHGSPIKELLEEYDE